MKPLRPIRLETVHSFHEMLEAMGSTAFTGRQLGKAYRILCEIFTDPDTLVVMTLSGALTVAKQGNILCDLIDRGYVDIVISTGALLTHGLIEGMGVQHFMAKDMDDYEAFRSGYNRVYDTIELETSFQGLENYIETHFESLFPAVIDQSPPAGSADFCNRLGRLFLQDFPVDRNILSSAARADIPVYIPAFTDSELSISIALSMLGTEPVDREQPFKNIRIPPFNPFADLIDYGRRINTHPGRLGILTLGGGVPRNWAQQVAPLIDILIQNGCDLAPKPFSRGVRICPEPVHWGGLSGCTYREGVSWGKFVPETEGGQYAEVYAEVTAVFPLLIKGVLEKLDGNAGK